MRKFKLCKPLQINSRTSSPSLHIDGRRSSHYFALSLTDHLSIQTLLWYGPMIPFNAGVHALKVSLRGFNTMVAS
jgi:hypothetical protein